MFAVAAIIAASSLDVVAASVSSCAQLFLTLKLLSDSSHTHEVIYASSFSTLLKHVDAQPPKPFFE